jgi:hypothetical protein
MSDNTSSPFEAIQTAVYTLLNGNVGAVVYDEVPPDAVFPYVVMGDVTDVFNEARGVKGRHVIFLLQVFAKDSGGKYQVAGILKSIAEKMTAAKLSMTGWKEVYKVYRTGRVVRDTKQPNVFYTGSAIFDISVCKS